MEGRYSSPRRGSNRSHRESGSGFSLFLRSPMVILLVLFGLGYFLVRGISSPSKKPEDNLNKPDTTSSARLDGGKTTTAETAAPTDSKPSEPVTTTAETVPVTTTTEPVTTEPPGPVMMTVDDRYFDDALFIGDSRTDGICLYSTPGQCKHFSYQSMTIYDIMTTDKISAYGYNNLPDLLKGMYFGKIYIMLGINECGYPTEGFAKKYKEVVEEIRSYQPDAIIYIQSICYVTQKHEQNYPVFATAGIKEKNEAIKALANDEDIFYLEVNDCLNDGTDHLPSDYTGDGAHLKPQYYKYWHQYLLEHAVVDAKHPWSANGTEPEGAQVEHP